MLSSLDLTLWIRKSSTLKYKTVLVLFFFFSSCFHLICSDLWMYSLFLFFTGEKNLMCIKPFTSVFFRFGAFYRCSIIIRIFFMCQDFARIQRDMHVSWFSLQKAEELVAMGVTGPEAHELCRPEEVSFKLSALQE